MQLVDPEITCRKLDREVDLWRESADIYRRRGWILLDRREEVVEVAFVGHLPLGPQMVPVISACVRLDYTNYDLWPPAVESSIRTASNAIVIAGGFALVPTAAGMTSLGAGVPGAAPGNAGRLRISEPALAARRSKLTKTGAELCAHSARRPPTKLSGHYVGGADSDTFVMRIRLRKVNTHGVNCNQYGTRVVLLEQQTKDRKKGERYGQNGKFFLLKTNLAGQRKLTAKRADRFCIRYSDRQPRRRYMKRNGSHYVVAQTGSTSDV